MTFARPIFNQGVGGKANRIVTNAWTDAAEMVSRHAEGLQWASSQLLQRHVSSMELCQVLSATPIGSGTNRWTYSIKLWTPPSPTGATGVSAPNDDRFTFATAYNLREWHNSSSSVDGMPSGPPTITVGPVGSTWTGTGFPTTNLAAKLMAWCVHDLSGAAFAYFDRPNPVYCVPNNAFEGEPE